jgi:hypothetical protein
MWGNLHRGFESLPLRQIPDQIGAGRLPEVLHLTGRAKRPEAQSEAQWTDALSDRQMEPGRRRPGRLHGSRDVSSPAARSLASLRSQLSSLSVGRGWTIRGFGSRHVRMARRRRRQPNLRDLPDRMGHRLQPLRLLDAAGRLIAREGDKIRVTGRADDFGVSLCAPGKPLSAETIEVLAD